MGQISLKSGFSSQKYGIVVVFNDDGTVASQTRITAQELADLNSSGNGIPPGVDKKQWTDVLPKSGAPRVIVYGMDFDVGDIKLEDNSYLKIMVDVALPLLTLAPGEYTINSGKISATPQQLTRAKAESPDLAKVVSISDNVMLTTDAVPVP